MSWSRLEPKLTYAREFDKNSRAHDTLNNKLRGHSLNERRDSAELIGWFDVAREKKVAAMGMYAAISRLNRKTRVLP